MEQYGSVAVLHADLINLKKEWVHSVLNLGERLINVNGRLAFSK